ncbi:MAG: PQQ-like beta-propeller repeat protein, partial [Anaerolineae bacterium]|nr:PQQ-like beta-propeller repeat protein [Anaerolineae bacterium]
MLGGCTGGGLRHESWPGLISVDGTLYVANLAHVEALNAETGKVYWSFPAAEEKKQQPFYAAPVFVPDVGDYGLLVVAGFTDRTVYGLALGASPAERPDEVWRFEGAGGQYVGSGIVADGLFVIGNGDGEVYALNVTDGAKVWEFSTRDRVWATPVVVDGTVYIASLDHHLYAVDLQTGAEQWRIEVAGAIAATPVYDGAGYLWVGDFASTLYQLDLDTHTVSWTFTADNWLWASPVLDGSTLYVADVGGTVYAIDTETLSQVWDIPASVGDVVRGRPALSADGSLLYVAGYEKGQVVAIDTVNGTVQQSWGMTLADPGRLPGDLVLDDARLYTMPVLVSERVQAFDPASGELLWSSPEATE